MTEEKCSNLYSASRGGDLAEAERLVPKLSPRDLNKLEPNGSSALHAACSNGYREIARLLLDYGASRQLKDSEGKTPKQLATKDDIVKLFDRPEEAVNERYGIYSNSRIEWLLDNDYAEELRRALMSRGLKDRGVKKTVQKIEKAGIIEADESRENKLTRFYLNEASEKNDPTLLLKVYTIQGPFFTNFNYFMAEGNKRKMFKKLRHKWSGYYTGLIMKNPALERFRFPGRTYRGMLLSEKDLQQYKLNTALTNKAFQSTSKSRIVASNFAHKQRRPNLGEVPAIIHYTFINSSSALDISSISEYPDEEEVLMLPGTCFRVAQINRNNIEFEIYLQEIDIRFI